MTFSTPLARVAAVTAALFVSYLAVAMALPVVPLFVAGAGFGPAAAGVATGAPFLVTVLTRGLAGRVADRRGGRRCMVAGLGVYMAASLGGAAATGTALPPMAAYALLVASRLLLGLGESLTAVGAIGWALAIGGPQRSGRVLATVGIGLYGAIAAGGPLGLLIAGKGGASAGLLAAAGAAAAGLLLVLPWPGVAPVPGERAPFRSVLGRIALPGAVVCLQGVGFAAIGAFLPLQFRAHGWSGAGLGLTGFGVGFVLMRLAGGHAPDRHSPALVAGLSLAVEAAGQLTVWAAPVPAVALAGTLLTGMGCSLVYPAMGREAVRRVPPHARATGIGAFSAFQDLAYGLTGPVAGVLAGHGGMAAPFALGAVAAVGGLLLAFRV